MGLLLMAKKDMEEGVSSIKYRHDDIKKHLHKILDIVVVGVKDNIEMDSNVRYMSNQIGCHDSRIDDHDRDLR